MQHSDHTDRKREHGAGGEGEGREEEAGTKDRFGKLQIHPTEMQTLGSRLGSVCARVI